VSETQALQWFQGQSDSMARSLKPFRVLGGTTKAFGVPSFHGKRQKTFRTATKPNSLKRSA